MSLGFGISVLAQSLDWGGKRHGWRPSFGLAGGGLRRRTGFVQALTALVLLAGLGGAGAHDAQTQANPLVPEGACPAPVLMPQKAQAPINLRFVGDLVLGNNHLVENVPKEWESQYFAGVAPYLRSADAAIGNLEGVLSTRGATLKNTSSGKSFAFRFPPHYAQLLSQTGFRALNLANNHSNDFGEVGFSDTLKHLQDAQIAPVGLKDQIAYIQVKGLTVAVIGFGFYPRQSMIQDLVGAAALVKQAKEKAPYVVVTFHAGAEGDAAVWHGDATENFLGEDRGNSVAFARAVVDAGADVVVGHGPHVLRAIECYKGRPVFYSLGNFVGVGGLSMRGAAALTAIAGVQLDPSGQLLGIEFLPAMMSPKKVPQVDERGFSTHLVNWLGRQASYKGDFLELPANPHTQAAFQAWLQTWNKPR